MPFMSPNLQILFQHLTTLFVVESPTPSNASLAARLAIFRSRGVQFETGNGIGPSQNNATLTIQSARPRKNCVHSSPTLTVSTNETW
jgi:hypothetical protein